MLLPLLLFYTCLTVVKGNCGPCGPVPKHYEELGYVGKYIDGPCCPERYECPDLATLDTSVCLLKGKKYRKGETVSKADSPLCSQDCMCDENGEGGLNFICPVQECAETFHNQETGCVNQYAVDQCCAVNRICGDKAKNLPQCIFRGAIYNYGDKFIPQSNYADCHQCVCDETFDNSTTIEENKNCRKTDCGIQLHDLDKFRQATEMDEIVPLEGLPEISCVKANALCKFGALTLQRGQSLATNEKCLECTCRHPPVIDCIRQEYCV